jgi:hypothetical protein
MTSAYQQLFVGLALAIVLIYLLIVVNFQSWLDPFVITLALPTAVAGVVWMLFATGTTLSVPALTASAAHQQELSSSPYARGKPDQLRSTTRATRRIRVRSHRCAGTLSTLRCHNIAVTCRGETKGKASTSRGAELANARAVRSDRIATISDCASVAAAASSGTRSVTRRASL